MELVVVPVRRRRRGWIVLIVALLVAVLVGVLVVTAVGVARPS